MLTLGQKAPDFSCKDQDGHEQTLGTLTGEWTLIYFYPKDDTPGCTKEACAITDVYHEFKKRGVVVAGVSKDSPASHKKFVEKYSLPFTLLSDEDGSVISSYGAWQEKTVFGKTALGIVRMSYLLNRDKEVVRIYPKVDPATHALEILKDIDSMIKV